MARLARARTVIFDGKYRRRSHARQAARRPVRGSVLVLTAVAHTRIALPLAAADVAVIIYLSYIMLVRVRSLCAICINITALGALILWQLLG
jgi:hypothetical protein